MAIGPGTELAGYRVQHSLGEGGMAVVYLAERQSDQQPVVLKVLRPELAGDELIRRRFEREARYVAALNHPNVVRVLDAGEHGEHLYLVMDYIEGTDLYAMLEDGPIGPRVALEILAPVADALDAAHAIGLLHRDVKPGNVLVEAGESRRCLLTDFGLSSRVREDSFALTAAGSFVGTLAYMAPEQILSDDPGPAIDVYSLGCVLYECLAGDPPFTGRSVKVMQSHIEEAPPKLARKGSPYTKAIDAVIARALAKDPGTRYATCSELVRAAADALAVGLPASRPAAPLPAVAAAAGNADGWLNLHVSGGGLDGTTIAVDSVLLIGRGQSGDGGLGGDVALSRNHALIRRTGDGALTIEDLDSRNGTYINGHRITGVRALDRGDEITMGDSTLVVVGEAPAAEPALAIAGLSLRVTFTPEMGAATLQLDEASGPIALRYRSGSWELAG